MSPMGHKNGVTLCIRIKCSHLECNWSLTWKFTRMANCSNSITIFRVNTLPSDQTALKAPLPGETLPFLFQINLHTTLAPPQHYYYYCCSPGDPSGQFGALQLESGGAPQNHHLTTCYYHIKILKLASSSADERTRSSEGLKSRLDRWEVLMLVVRARTQSIV